MASRKKLRRKFANNEIDYKDLSYDEKKYIDKYVGKIIRDTNTGKDTALPTYKEVPCQMWPGKKVFVPVTANVITGRDGKLYIDEEDPKNLVISKSWKTKKSAERSAALQKKREDTRQAVIDMKPTTLGE